MYRGRALWSRQRQDQVGAALLQNHFSPCSRHHPSALASIVARLVASGPGPDPPCFSVMNIAPVSKCHPGR